MNTFPDIKLNVGDYVEAFVKYLVDNFSVVFDAIRDFFSMILINMQDFLIWFPWWAFIIVIFLLGWRFKSLPAGILFAALMFLVGTFGMWEEMMITIAIVLTAVIISLIIGIPLGVLMAFSKWFSAMTRPVLDAMQTMPSFVYLIPAIFFFGLGNVPGIFATLIYALPPVIRLTELALRNVDSEVIESAESFGSSRWQMLTKVQLPQALPTIMAGVNQTTMMALAMVVIASMVGAQGLGEQVLIAINRIDISLGFEAGISIVFLAIIIDRVSGGVAERFQKHRGTE
ncbi:proline/glycine betaine ABC transporter permease [Alkalihalobacillus sp. AL-G]|uniref:ABC transporter permease n=1 Tax=Alkalihalobacillus sp. AL-G TaxID=2926399 RepID=UPI00272C2042|nr:proline/glycine betaine ABC transporter permease [Alkalihalobacillus sp. AL-G]WLD93094.1 proline/glycine betaine ABC transporter permease [Alkalihalobacillus sp. AL-G]